MLRKRLTMFAILAIVALVIIMAVPVGAATPERVTFDTTIIYTLNDLDSGTGTWSMGILSGEATESSDNAGYYRPEWPGWFVRTFHNETILSDDNGSITIQSQMRVTNFNPLYFEYVGQWTIVPGDGEPENDYENAHGSGNFSGYAIVDPSAGTLTAYTDYSGKVHMDP